MGDDARQTTDQPAKHVFFEDPDRPGKSRHLKCCLNAGIDPQGLQQTQGPCWVCLRSAGEEVVYEGNRLFALDQKRLAEALKALAKSALSLSNAVRLLHGVGPIRRVALEEGYKPQLVRFRRAWKTARDLSEIGLEGASDLGPVTSRAWLETRGAPTPSKVLRQDPIIADEVDIADIELRAGWFAMAARALHEEATESLTMLRDNKGKDGTEALRRATEALSADRLTVARELVSLRPELAVAIDKEDADKEDADGQHEIVEPPTDEEKRAAKQRADDAAAQRLVHAWDERASNHRRKSEKPQRAK